jgi:hypothetical protein
VRASGELEHRAGSGHGALDEVEGHTRRHGRRRGTRADVQRLTELEAGGEGAALDRRAAHRHAVDGRLALARPQRDTGTGAAVGVGDHEREGRAARAEAADLTGHGGQHAVGSGTRHAEAGVEGRHEGGRAGRVDPQQTAAATCDDGVSGEDFTAVGHGGQPK